MLPHRAFPRFCRSRSPPGWPRISSRGGCTDRDGQLLSERGSGQAVSRCHHAGRGSAYLRIYMDLSDTDLPFCPSGGYLSAFLTGFLKFFGNSSGREENSVLYYFRVLCRLKTRASKPDHRGSQSSWHAFRPPCRLKQMHPGYIHTQDYRQSLRSRSQHRQKEFLSVSD